MGDPMDMDTPVLLVPWQTGVVNQRYDGYALTVFGERCGSAEDPRVVAVLVGHEQKDSVVCSAAVPG